jgi:hypothetical protein
MIIRLTTTQVKSHLHLTITSEMRIAIEYQYPTEITRDL